MDQIDLNSIVKGLKNCLLHLQESSGSPLLTVKTEDNDRIESEFMNLSQLFNKDFYTITFGPNKSCLLHLTVTLVLSVSRLGTDDSITTKLSTSPMNTPVIMTKSKEAQLHSPTFEAQPSTSSDMPRMNSSMKDTILCPLTSPCIEALSPALNKVACMVSLVK